MIWIGLVFTATVVVAVTTTEDSKSSGQRVPRQFHGNLNQRPQVLPPPQFQQNINSGLGKSDSSRSNRNQNPHKNEEKVFSADSSYGLGQQNVQPIQERFWTSSGNIWNGGGNNGWGWNNNNYGNNRFWNTNSHGWNQGGGQKPGSCGRPVPYNSFNQNLNSGYYFDRSDDESRNIEEIDARMKRKASRTNTDDYTRVSLGKDVPNNNHRVIKRGYSSGPTPYYNQGGSFGAGVGYLSGYTLPAGYNRYNTNYYAGGVHGSNGGYHGGGQGGNGIGTGWSSSGRYCIRDYECTGNRKCCGGVCTTPIYYG